MSKILITCGTQAFSQRIAILLQALENDVFFASSDPIPEVLLKNGRYRLLPKFEHPIFVHELVKIALDFDVDAIVPLSANEIHRISKEVTLFEEYGIKLHMPNVDMFEDLEILINPPRSLELVFQDMGFVTYNDESSAYLCLAE